MLYPSVKIKKKREEMIGNLDRPTHQNLCNIPKNPRPWAPTPKKNKKNKKIEGEDQKKGRKWGTNDNYLTMGYLSIQFVNDIMLIKQCSIINLFQLYRMKPSKSFTSSWLTHTEWAASKLSSRNLIFSRYATVPRSTPRVFATCWFS